jgi:hypothetical protein
MEKRERCRFHALPFDNEVEPIPRHRNKEPSMKFAFLGYHSESNWGAMSQSEQDAMVDDCFTYDAKLLKEGHMTDDGAALQPSRTAKILRWRNGAVVVTDGPFAETKEQLGGIGVLEANDVMHAVELLSKHPGLNYGATFEIRPVDEESLQRKAEALAAIRSSAPAVDPEAQKFASMGYINEAGWAKKSPSDFDAMMKQCIAFDEARIENGQWLTGIALRTARAAKTLRANAGKVVVTDGPFAETKEYLGGLVVVALPSLDDAVEMLSKHPALPFGVVMEIRPVNEEITRRWDAQQGRVHYA